MGKIEKWEDMTEVFTDAGIDKLIEAKNPKFGFPLLGFDYEGTKVWYKITRITPKRKVWAKLADTYTVNEFNKKFGKKNKVE